MLGMLLAWGGLELSKSRTFQVAGELLARIPTSDSLIALTFDDGPTDVYTDSILTMLEELDARNLSTPMRQIAVGY